MMNHFSSCAFYLLTCLYVISEERRNRIDLVRGDLISELSTRDLWKVKVDENLKKRQAKSKKIKNKEENKKKDKVNILQL